MGKSILPVRAQDVLLEQLEYDITGLIDAAKLTFDQRIQYSIALSLKNLNDHLQRSNS